jgi:hypothetical protein
MSRHARVKREEAKQGLSLHDVRMNGLTIRGVIRTGDAERIDCPAPMQGGDVIRRRWNNLESIKDRAESHDECPSRFDDRDIVRYGFAWFETVAPCALTRTPCERVRPSLALRR